MSDKGNLNNPTQAPLSATGGNVTNLGGTLRVTAGGDVTDASATGATTADTGIDPATGKPVVPPAETVDPALGERNPDGTFKPKEAPAKTAEELAAEAEAAKTPKAPTPAEIEAAKTEAAKTDPRFVPYTEEFMTKGDLTPESRDKAAKDFGVSRAIVDAWVEGQKATKQIGTAAAAVDQVQADRTVATIKAMAGTEAEYTQFSTWANANLPAAEMATLVDAINSNNPAFYKLAMNDAVAKWKAGGGGTGPVDLTRGAGNSQVNQVGGYKSAQEQSAAINDPRYSRDAVYRAEVAAKIAVTRF